MNQCKHPLLVIVHPGSACGSADMNLGGEAASAARDFLSADIAAWRGDVLVVDGELSDELKAYPALNRAIKAALRRAKKSKLISDRLFACDNLGPSISHALPARLRQLQVTPDRFSIALTGAWTTRGGLWGCVDDAQKAVNKIGFESAIRDSAVAEQQD